ncbi:MAG TPA: hypothetical protein ENN80_12285 [Candidatus Hydrogenedentes bacterium]|nr:hypothetical protein [Candidatus Hydrogenedentota bacterium]
MPSPAPIDVRPYQLMAIVSKIGEGCTDDLGDVRLNRILAAIRANPATPLTLRCNVTSDYAFQNPGMQDDTPEGALFNVRRDLVILQRLGLTPGATRPALDLFEHLLEAIDSADGILCFDTATSGAWRGQPREACYYEQGRALGIEAIIPARAPEEMQRVKRDSVRAMYEADVLELRPHHLMCMTCFHGGRDDLAPINEDNLFEAIDIIQKNPDIPIRLICGPCMICPPCPQMHPNANGCVGGHGMALRDELKDLDVLQRLGLRYGDTLTARRLFTRLYAEIASAKQICGYGDGIARSREWSICGGDDVNARYAKGRAAGLGFLPPVT